MEFSTVEAITEETTKSKFCRTNKHKKGEMSTPRHRFRREDHWATEKTPIRNEFFHEHKKSYPLHVTFDLVNNLPATVTSKKYSIDLQERRNFSTSPLAMASLPGCRVESSVRGRDNSSARNSSITRMQLSMDKLCASRENFISKHSGGTHSENSLKQVHLTRNYVDKLLVKHRTIESAIDYAKMKGGFAPATSVFASKAVKTPMPGH